MHHVPRTRLTLPASAGGLTRTLVPSYSALCRPAFIPALRLSQRFLLWGFGVAQGFACMRCASFKPFGPLALASQALAAIVLAALRRFRGVALFRGSRSFSSQGAPFRPSGLTLQSSGLAYGQPLTLAVRQKALCIIQLRGKFEAKPSYKGA